MVCVCISCCSAAAGCPFLQLPRNLPGICAFLLLLLLLAFACAHPKKGPHDMRVVFVMAFHVSVTEVSGQQSNGKGIRVAQESQGQLQGFGSSLLFESKTG